MRLSSPRKEKEEAYPKLSNTDYSLADTPSGLLLVRRCIDVFALFGFTLIARSRLPMLPALCVHPDLVRIQGTPVSVILIFCRRSKILRAERFHIAVAQAIERQPCQGKFLRERSKNRFPLGLIRFPRSDVVEAFSRLLVIL